MADHTQALGFTTAQAAPSAQLIDSHAQQVIDIGTPPTLDTTVPIVGNFNPVLGNIIQAQQPITFTVTDDSGSFRRILVHARFGDGLEEVIFNGTSFRGLYGGGNSSRVIITSGFQFTVLRRGGWVQGGPAAINVFAIDAAGNEAA